MPSKTIEDFAYQVRDYMRGAKVVKGKNYLYNNAPATNTSHHIEFTKNADLTITANGNNTDETAAWVKINENVSLPNGDWVLSGGKSAIKNISFTIGGTVYKDTGDGVQFTINNTVIPEIILYIKGEVDNEVFSPMICTLDEWNKSHTYEPYYVPVKDSKADITAIATEENGSTASKAYRVGDRFYRNGAFCTCIADIAIGGTFTENTNYRAKNIGIEYNNLMDIMIGDYYIDNGIDADTVTCILVGVNGYASNSNMPTDLNSGMGILFTLAISERAVDLQLNKINATRRQYLLATTGFWTRLYNASTTSWGNWTKHSI